MNVRESTAQQLSFEWSHTGVSSIDFEVFCEAYSIRPSTFNLINYAWYKYVDSLFNFSFNRLAVGTVRSGTEPLV